MKEWFAKMSNSFLHGVKYTFQIILLGATLAGAILLVYDFTISFFESPDLVVQEMTIAGNQRTSEAEIRARVQIPDGTNIWLIDLDAIAGRIENHAWIKTCGVQRIPPQRIHIQVVEREALVYLLNPEDSRLYGMDREGVVLPPMLADMQSYPKKEEEIQLILSSPLLSGVDINFEPGHQIEKNHVLSSLRFLHRLKQESANLFQQIVEAEWREDGTFVLHPKTQIGLVVLKDLEALDLEKKLKQFWTILVEENIHAVYVDARFPDKGFAVRFQDGEDANWQRLYQWKGSYITTIGWSES
jgi:hypothetical protein